MVPNGKVIEVDLETMIAECSALGDNWRALSECIDLDSVPDNEIDFGFDCCSTSEETIVHVDAAIKQMLGCFCGPI